ncbi:MAG: MurT ligase domain-containing protein [Firmicutes bacterium]|nr:MurT ligase domain-containing protein [Bacillota bacterium]
MIQAIRASIAIVVSRWVATVLRWTGRAGTSLPGLVATRISPQLVHRLLRQLDTCVLVTGTNGKTTTTEYLHALLSQDADRWLVNRGGANLLQGLLAALLTVSDARGRLRIRRAVLEVDEATLPLIAQSAHPRLVVLTNVMRDQLDRYGEIDQTLALLNRGLSDPSVTLVANADDPLCAALAEGRMDTVLYGFSSEVATPGCPDGVRDGAFCLKCGAELTYAGYFYGQFGMYECGHCGFGRVEPHFTGRVSSCDGFRQLEVEEVARRTSIQYSVALGLSGLYNAYNLLAAVAAARTLGVAPDRLNEGVARFSPPIGRMQVFPGDPESVLALIKNPAGANSVLRALIQDPREMAVCFAINDQDADGRDVSWLWDVDVEDFVATVTCQRFYCAGTRAADMALRLAYAGVPRERVTVLAALDDVTGIACGGQVQVLYVLSTYTALHPLAERLPRRLGLRRMVSEEVHA